MKKPTMMLTCALAIGTVLIQPNTMQAQAQAPAATNPRTALADSASVILKETAATRDQLQTTLNSLTALTKQDKGDLVPTYNAFVDEVKKTHVVADNTTARIAAMQEASKTYFDGWQAEIAGINNESLRKQAQKRMDKVQGNYNDVIKSLQDASEKFKPLLSNLDDVQKMLANDTTPGGVKAVKGIVGDANWSMKKVRSYIGDAIEELGDMAKSLSSKAED